MVQRLVSSRLLSDAYRQGRRCGATRKAPIHHLILPSLTKKKRVHRGVHFFATTNIARAT